MPPHVPRPPTATLAALAVSAGLLSPLRAAPPAAPTDLQVSIPRTGALDATWVDNSEDETGFRLEFRIPPNEDWFNIFTYATDVTSASLNGGVAGVSYEFRVVGINDDGESPSEIATITVPNAMTSPPYAHIRVGEPFSYTIETSNGGDSATRTFAASPLPGGLTVDPATGTISGTPTTDGYFETLVTVSFDDPPSPTIEATLDLRIPPVPGPPQATPFPTVALAAMAPPDTVDLADHFVDPDTRDAVRFETSAGTMVASLFHRATPAPVENFKGYVSRGAYTDSVFHRSVDAATFDIIQTGSFVGDASGMDSIDTDPPIDNAPGIPNDRGTIAYARTSDPDSATAGFYFNTQDSPGLDTGDSYTVFGRLTAASYPVMDAIFAAPTGTHAIITNGSSRNWQDFPTTDGNAPAIGPPTNLITVDSAVCIPALTFAVDSNSAPAVANVTVTEVEGAPQLEVAPLSPGTAEAVVSATDVDGNTATATLTVEVAESFAWWAAANGAGAPGDRSDAGPLTDLQEYGFGGDPADPSDDRLLLPEATVVELDGATFDALTFRHRTAAGDLIYTVESSTDLEEWTPLWQTGDGFGSPAIFSANDDGDFKVVTVRRPEPNGGTGSMYLRSTLSLTGG